MQKRTSLGIGDGRSLVYVRKEEVLVSTKRKRKRKEVVRLSRRGSAVGSPSGIGSAVGSALSAVLVSAAGVSESVK